MINANRLKELRVQKKLSIRRLAEISGVSPGLISDLENGHVNNTTIDSLCRLAKIFQVDVTELFRCE